MADKSKNDFEGKSSPARGEVVNMDDLEAWFVREVLPLETVLIQYLSRGGHNRTVVEDLRQDPYEKACAAAQSTILGPTRLFLP